MYGALGFKGERSTLMDPINARQHASRSRRDQRLTAAVSTIFSGPQRCGAASAALCGKLQRSDLGFDFSTTLAPSPSFVHFVQGANATPSEHAVYSVLAATLFSITCQFRCELLRSCLSIGVKAAAEGGWQRRFASVMSSDAIAGYVMEFSIARWRRRASLLTLGSIRSLRSRCP